MTIKYIGSLIKDLLILSGYNQMWSSLLVIKNYLLYCFSNFKQPYTRTILNVNEYIGEVYEQCNFMLSILRLDEKCVEKLL